VPDLRDHAPTPDGGQRAPGLRALVLALGSVLRALPGMALTTVRYLAHRHRVEHEVVDLEGDPGDTVHPDAGPDAAA